MKQRLLFAATAATLLFSTSRSGAQASGTPTPESEEPIELETVVVTPFLQPRSADDFGQPVFQTEGGKLLRQNQPTLGETLDSSPGVTSTYYGPGSSRPIIRGFDGDRIRVVTNGMATIDASVISPDHAVTVEPMFADRVEIIRGPATLLYGSSAMGGVVNVLDPSLPDTPPKAPVSGEIAGRYGSNNDEWVGMVRAEGGNDSVGWFLSGLKRNTGDIQIPSEPDLHHDHEDDDHDEDHDDEEHHEEDFDGTLPNSAVSTQTLTVGLSGFAEHGFASIAYTLYDTRYGIPGGHEHGEEDEHDDEDEHEEAHEEEGPVQVDLKQRRVLARAGLTQPVEWLEEINLKLAYADYEHTELEGEEIGTRFTTEGFEANLNAVHKEYMGFVGAFGMEFTKSDLAAMGDEAFIPPTDTAKWSVFGVESREFESLTGQFGFRAERQTVKVTDGSGRSVDKNGLSLSAGAVWRFVDDYSLGLSLSSTQRLPNAEELYADGPHAATRSYQIGNPALGKETAYSADLVLRKRTGRLTGELSLFASRIDNYIFSQLTPDVEDGLPVYLYVARDAEFIGGEFEATVSLVDTDEYDVAFTLMADAVRATDTETNEPLPRIPPLRYGAGLDLTRHGWSCGVECIHATEQDRTAPLETDTAAYTLVSAYVNYDFGWSGTDWTIYLKGTNLFDEEARASTSYLKDTVPFPGRNLMAGVRMAF